MEKENITKCPKGHPNIRVLALADKRYIFCFDCVKKYSEEDYGRERWKE